MSFKQKEDRKVRVTNDSWFYTIYNDKYFLNIGNSYNLVKLSKTISNFICSTELKNLSEYVIFNYDQDKFYITNKTTKRKLAFTHEQIYSLNLALKRAIKQRMEELTKAGEIPPLQKKTRKVKEKAPF